MEVDPRVAEAVTHVQRAGLELIAAMRNALELAEDLIGDPQALQTLFDGAVTAARTMTEATNQSVQRIPVDD